MTTPHISAPDDAFAPDVLMPGDPRRAQRIAETVLDHAELVTDVRGILGYTGTYGGRPLSVMASGMGIPSAGIYITELFRFYGVQRIVRVGTAGGIAPGVAMGDVVVATAAHTDSAFWDSRFSGIRYSFTPSFRLAAAAVQVADENVAKADAATGEAAYAVHAGPVLTSDTFYSDIERMRPLAAMGTLAVEMETAGLYGLANAEGREALSVLTVSDLVFGTDAMSAVDREELFGRALGVALGAVTR